MSEDKWGNVISELEVVKRRLARLDHFEEEAETIEDAIVLLKEQQETIWALEIDLDDTLDVMCEYADELKAALQAQGGWISVKDRLPVERENWITRDWQHVICCCDFGGDPRRIDVRTYGFGRGHFWHGPQIMDGVVTHWMPLPEPPETDERGGDE